MMGENQKDTRLSEPSVEKKEENNEENLKFLKDYISEVDERTKFKKKLREENLKAIENPPEDSFFTKLDSSLKKNTAFVKKVKSISESQKESIINDFNKLNLTKYIGEISSGLTEAKIKMADINSVLQVASLLHQRYSDFSGHFLEQWHKVLKGKKDEKNQSKLRVDLRLFSELLSVGVFVEKEALNLLAQLLNSLTNLDKEHLNVSIIISFCKHCGDDYAGLVSRKIRLLSEQFNLQVPRSQFLKPERQKPCRSMLKDYFTSLQEHVRRDCRQLREEKKYNKRIMQTKGELSEGRQNQVEQQQQAFNKILTNANNLADLLDEVSIQLPEEDNSTDEEQANMFDVYHPFRNLDGMDEGEGLFEDEETRQFYEMIPDLKALIPMILYKDSEQPNTTNNQDETPHSEEDLELNEGEGGEEGLKDALEESLKESDGLKDGMNEEMEVDVRGEEDPELLAQTEGDDDLGSVGSNARLMLEMFLNDLPNCVNRELIDKAATNFCTNLNTKGNRNKLVKVLFLVNRNRCDLLAFYSRLVATLHPCMPSLSSELNLLLRKDFRFKLKKKDQINLESKLKVTRFIAELVKFKMFNCNDALFCLKLLITDFKHHNIEMACALLEGCGRFLYRSPQSHHRIKHYLDVMMRKKSSLAYDSRYMMMIENAYHYTNPPSTSTATQLIKPLPPQQAFVSKLICKTMNKKNVEEVVRLVRKIDWKDVELKDFLIETLTNVWLVKYTNIQCCAKFLAFIAIDQNDVGVQVVDAVLEFIRSTMENNDSKQRQQRVAMMKYLGDLYNYKMIESEEVFNCLYLLIHYNTSYEESKPHPLDPPEHLLRIRLVCKLLTTCGQYFCRGLSMKKLDCFLIYFQRYYWFKKSSSVWSEECPFPSSITNEVDELFEFLRPKMVQCKCWLEANEAANVLDLQQKEKILKYMRTMEEQRGTTGATTLATIHESASDGEEGDGTEARMDERVDKESDTDTDTEADSESDSSLSDKQFQSISTGGTLKSSLAEECPEEESQFQNSFDKMVADSFKARQQEINKVTRVDIAVPMGTTKLLSHNTTTTTTATTTATKNNKPINNSNNSATMPTIPFVFLNKKGNKQQYSRVDIPLNETLASRLSQHKKHVEEEKEVMKEKVLQIIQMQEQEKYQNEVQAVQSDLQKKFQSTGLYKK